jgi:hypothetical protein
LDQEWEKGRPSTVEIYAITTNEWRRTNQSIIETSAL